MVKQSKFSYKNPGESECVKARASNVKVSFKNLLETGNAVRGMSVKRAQGYLKNVIARTECVPFRKFKGGIGKCAQAKQFKTTIVSKHFNLKKMRNIKLKFTNSSFPAHQSVNQRVQFVLERAKRF